MTALLASEKDFSPLSSKRKKVCRIIESDVIDNLSVAFGWATDDIPSIKSLLDESDISSETLLDISNDCKEALSKCIVILANDIEKRKRGPMLGTCLSNHKSICNDLARIFHISLNLSDIFALLSGPGKIVKDPFKGFKLNFTLRYICKTAVMQSRKEIKLVALEQGIEKIDLTRINSGTIVRISKYIEKFPNTQEQTVSNLKFLLAELPSRFLDGELSDIFESFVCRIPFVGSDTEF